MDSDERYHSESEFYYPDEIINDHEKHYIGAISNEEMTEAVGFFMKRCVHSQEKKNKNVYSPASTKNMYVCVHLARS